MNLQLEINGRLFAADLANSTDISIPMNFNNGQPNSYDVPNAIAKPYSGEGWIGDTRQGGSCNFDAVNLIPHCNGTHTECVGHIARERITVNETLKDIIVRASVISVEPVMGIDSGESYDPAFEPCDKAITENDLRGRIIPTAFGASTALVIRTLPNEESKKTRRYSAHPAPFFTREAIEFINALNVKHLLVDFPSLDRAHDNGLLTAHHLFWDVEEGTHRVNRNNHSVKTVTEFIYVPDEVKDGEYLLNLQTAPFLLDAAPSRPVLIPIRAV